MPLSQFDRENIGEIVAGHGTWFTAILIRLIARADAVNRARLAKAFPEEVEAYKKWYHGELFTGSEETDVD